jgi:hypothetical protein
MGCYQAYHAVLKAPAGAIVNILALDTWVEMTDKSRLRGRQVGGWRASMLAEPNRLPGSAAENTNKTPVIRVRNLLSVTRTLLLKLLLATSPSWRPSHPS